MKITGKQFDEERAFYGLKDIELESCRIEGPADGESALKECGFVTVKDCFFDLRYPFWHDKSVKMNACFLTENCRAAFWYSNNIEIIGSKLHGIKAMRECKNIEIKDTDIISPEFGWSSKDISFYNVDASSEYFMLRGKNIKANNLRFKGKYSFQYVNGATLENCTFDTKDAFWHSTGVTVKNCTVKGEYLGWYSRGLTFIDCEIIGTQPLCYCKDLKLVNCKMKETDLAFERSETTASIIGHVDSIKNPYKGVIEVDSVGEIIRDDKRSVGEIIIRTK